MKNEGTKMKNVHDSTLKLFLGLSKPEALCQKMFYKINRLSALGIWMLHCQKNLTESNSMSSKIVKLD